MATSFYVIVGFQLGTRYLSAGKLISDPATVSTARAMGALLWDSSDSIVASAAANAQIAARRGAQREALGAIMLASIGQQGAEYTFTNNTPLCTTSGTFSLQP